MKNILVLLSVIISSITASSYYSKDQNQVEELKTTTNFTADLTTDQEAKKLLETKCNMCHSVKASEEAMIAPPFKNIQKKYKKVSANKQEFVDAIVDFNMEPTKDKAMMYGALKKFGVMAKMPYSKEDVIKIANYMYNAEFETPKWCN